MRSKVKVKVIVSNEVKGQCNEVKLKHEVKVKGVEVKVKGREAYVKGQGHKVRILSRV